MPSTLFGADFAAKCLENACRERASAQTHVNDLWIHTQSTFVAKPLGARRS